MGQKIETIVVGGSQAGLSTSYHLVRRGHEHIVLEQASQTGNAWRNDRWDSFTLVTPNWAVRMPGAVYQGSDRDGFMPRAEVITYLEQYIERYNLPIRYGEQVISVEPVSEGVGGYLVKTQAEEYAARNVVIATGQFQKPKLHPSSGNLTPGITQIHSGQYRNPQALPPGAVLVIGSAQSGCQIVEELYQSGRQVYLCVSSAGRAPRRYRGKDIFEWVDLTGFLDRTVEQLPSPQARFAGNPHLSGKDGGHTLNLHQFSRDGVKLLGRFLGGRDNTIWLASNLHENLAKADKFETEICKRVDDFIEKNGWDIPEESLISLRDGYNVAEVTELNLETAGISTIIWALGYSFDFSLVRLPLFDSTGFPIQNQGLTRYPGLAFVGLNWLNKQRSGLLIGVGDQADFVVNSIAARGS